MKTFLKASLALATLAVSAQAASITLNLNAGVLQTPDGSPIPDGSLVQLVVSTADGAFSAPDRLSFVGSSVDDVVVASFALNGSTLLGAGSGSFSVGAPTSTISYDPNFYRNGVTIGAGMPMLLRWWPSLSAPAGSPGDFGPRFGEFRTAAVLDGSDIGWVTPASGNVASLNFYTSSVGGTNADTLARASSQVTPVPEPTTVSLVLTGLIGLCVRRRKR